MMLKEFTF